MLKSEILELVSYNNLAQHGKCPIFVLLQKSVHPTVLSYLFKFLSCCRCTGAYIQYILFAPLDGKFTLFILIQAENALTECLISSLTFNRIFLSPIFTQIVNEIAQNKARLSNANC